MTTQTKYRTEDKEVLIALAKNGSRMGDTISELAEMTGFSAQRLIAVAKRYDGQRIGRLIISYIPPQNASWNDCSPGIANPRTGICQRVPAAIAVKVAGRR